MKKIGKNSYVKADGAIFPRDIVEAIWRSNRATEWYFRQLLPFTYRGEFSRKDKGNTDSATRYFAVWNMWFGKIFNYEEYEIVAKNAETGKGWKK